MPNKKDQLKIEIITKVLAGLIDRKLAAKILNVSYRSVLRYVKAYRSKGASFIYHGNKNKKSKNSKPEEIKNKIIKLLTEKYYDFSVRHAWEKLKDENLQLISYKTLLRWCHEKKFIKRFTRKRKIHRARKRMPQRGLMLQMDGSYHNWYGDKKSCLIGVIDDANNEISYAEFFNSENTLDCMNVIQKIIEKYGIFNILYVDKAGVFGGNKRYDFCQLEEACKEIGIQIIYAHSPEAKGRIERLWRTLQGRLIPEMRLAGVCTRKMANNFLQNHFIPNEYNKLFLKEAINNESAYKQCHRSDLTEIFSKKEYRSIKGDQTFNFNNVRYLINDFPGNLRGKMVQIRTYQDRSVKYFWADKELNIQSFPQDIKKVA